MKAIVKGLIIGLIVIVIGAAILITALALNGWTFKKPEFVNQTFTATEDNTVIKYKNQNIRSAKEGSPTADAFRPSESPYQFAGFRETPNCFSYPTPNRN